MKTRKPKIHAIDLSSTPRKPMSTAEAQRRWRAKHGNKNIIFTAHVEAAAAMLYLKKQWGFKSTQETVEVSMRHLALLTRLGLQRIDLSID